MATVPTVGRTLAPVPSGCNYATVPEVTATGPIVGVTDRLWDSAICMCRGQRRVGLLPIVAPPFAHGLYLQAVRLSWPGSVPLDRASGDFTHAVPPWSLVDVRRYRSTETLHTGRSQIEHECRAIQGDLLLDHCVSLRQLLAGEIIDPHNQLYPRHSKISLRHRQDSKRGPPRILRNDPRSRE